MNFLAKLIGKQIQEIHHAEGQFFGIGGTGNQVVDEIILIIEDFRLTISNPIELDPLLSDIQKLEGKYIHEIVDSDAFIKITTKDGKWLVIDMRSESYIGPEALVLHGPDNLCVVWN